LPVRPAARHGAASLAALLVGMPLVYWIEPNTAAGATLLVVVVLLAANVAAAVVPRRRRDRAGPARPTDY
jgi:hypothetical protein